MTRHLQLSLLQARQGALLRSALGMLLFFSAALVLFWMLLVPVVVEWSIRARTGFRVDIASLACNPFEGTLRLKDMRVHNPGGFGESDFLHVSHLRLEVSLSSLDRDTLVVPKLYMKVDRSTVVFNESGTSNAALFVARLAEGKSISERPFIIEHYWVIWDETQIVYQMEDRSGSQLFRPRYDRQFKNVDSLEGFLRPFAEQAARYGFLNSIRDELAKSESDAADSQKELLDRLTDLPFIKELQNSLDLMEIFFDSESESGNK